MNDLHLQGRNFNGQVFRPASIDMREPTYTVDSVSPRDRMCTHAQPTKTDMSSYILCHLSIVFAYGGSGLSVRAWPNLLLVCDSILRLTKSTAWHISYRHGH